MGENIGNIFIIQICTWNILRTLTIQWKEENPSFLDAQNICQESQIWRVFTKIYDWQVSTWKDAQYNSVQFSSVTQLCLPLCDPVNRSMPGLPVHHQLPEFTQTHVHRVGDAIQPSHPLSSPSLPASNPSQHQGLFQWVNSSHKVAKVISHYENKYTTSTQSLEWLKWKGRTATSMDKDVKQVECLYTDSGI